MCDSYTLLIGRPPFETDNIKTTYKKIKAVDYRIPSSSLLSEEAKNIIRATLAGDPQLRPSLETLRNHPFFTKLPVPAALPVSALTMACAVSRAAGLMLAGADIC